MNYKGEVPGNGVLTKFTPFEPAGPVNLLERRLHGQFGFLKHSVWHGNAEISSTIVLALDVAMTASWAYHGVDLDRIRYRRSSAS
jgi:hypothetical protein